MPNFWTKTNQSFYEAFHGPKTVDEEFNQKIEEVKKAEKSFTLFNHHLKSLPNYHNGMKTNLNYIPNLIESLYDKESPHFSQATHLNKAHHEIMKYFDHHHMQMQKITLADFDTRLDAVKRNIKERDRLRRIYDHYDDKIEKYVKKRNANLEKGKAESTAFIEAFDRVICY